MNWKEVTSALKKRKLTYIFYNPNTAEATADYLAKLFIEVNAPKVEERIKSAVADNKEEECYPAIAW